ncbi:uncharacterized protein [Asterias amurensis]|uniref:uncharacterized protein isoform X2 n=1 Tax=Asterias amurensis TaxID=7602 RepID=UPI003AB5DB57
MMMTKWLVLILLLASFSCTYGQANNTTTAIPTNTTDFLPPITSTEDTNMSFTFIARTNASASPALPPEPQQYCNASIIDGLQQQFNREYMDYHTLTDISDEDTCNLRKSVNEYLVDYCSPASAVYCDSYFDTIMCWPPSPVGLNSRPCPEELNGVSYDTSDNVTRYCNLDGTWANGNKSNYSLCSPRNLPEMTGHDAVLKIIVYIGYSLSMGALLGAFCIFLFFRSLRCVRNYIHWNLVSSFILLYICFFTTTAATNTYIEKPGLHWLCRLSFTMMMYIMMTNFFWMFVEGVYLYTLVVRALTVRRNRFWLYCIFGWGGPLPFVVTFIIMKVFNSKDCWVDDAPDVYLIVAPIICVILVNLYFLVHIMCILFTKLRASHSLETQQYRKGVKGTLFLLPLLGVTYLLFLLGPISVQNPQRPPSFYVYQYLNTILSSIQGFLVAIIYVFLNQEVQNVIKRKIRRWREENTLPTRIVSRRGSNQRNSIGNIFVGRRSVNCNTMADDDTNVTAFKLPACNRSPDVFSNGSKVPPFIRLDEIQPLTPASETHASPQTLYSSLGSNGADSGDMQQVNLEEKEADASCNGTNGSTDTDCNELPLLAVNACGAQSPNSSPDQSPSEELDREIRKESQIATEKDQDLPYRTVDNNGLSNGNHNNNNSLSPRLARPKTSPFTGGRTRVTFAEDPVQENLKRPACCDLGKNNEGLARSPTRKVEEPIARGHVEGDESLEGGFSSKQDPQRSPLIPCIRKKPWSTKPNGTIAFPKAPEGTPV